MSLYNLHYLEFLATSHDKFWSHPNRRPGLIWEGVYLSLLGSSKPEFGCCSGKEGGKFRASMSDGPVP